MAGQPAEPGEEASPSPEHLGSDLGQELKVHDPSWTISWPSRWSSDLVEATDFVTTPQSAEGRLSTVSILMSPQDLPGHLEHLDPKVLRLLLAQKDLEIQSLQKAARAQPGKRMAYILHELTDSKLERTSREQISSLQRQIEEMAKQISDQKERACQEKTELENQLQQANKNLRLLEEEVQTFQRSCLLNLAHSSWAGRVLRSQTGSVEVLTAESLMVDLSDQSLEQSSLEEQHFCLEDVDWNSVARRYPNLFEDLYSKKRVTSAQVMDSPDQSDFHPEKPQHRREKSVEWSLLPNSSHSFPGDLIMDGVSTGHSSVPSFIGPDSSPSFQSPTEVQEVGTCGALPALELRKAKAPVDSRSSLCAAVVGIGLARQGSLSGSLQDQGGRKVLDSSLRIVKIDRHGKFIQVLNESLEESVDISGFVLKQLVHRFPVCVYRFPQDTVLAPQHHATVWGEGVSLAGKCMPQTPQRALIHFHTNPGCVTLLLNHKGQVMSEYQAQHSVTEASRSFDDHTDVSVDCFPLPEAEREKPQEAPGLGSKNHYRHFRNRKKPKVPGPSQGMEEQAGPPGVRPLDPIPSINVPKKFSQREAKETAAFAASPGAMVSLPSIPELAQLPGIGKKMQKCLLGAVQFRPPQLCRKFVDQDCPMVALSVQKTSESRFGLKHLSYPPITTALRET